MNNDVDVQYLGIVKDILENGFDRPDRTGVGRRSVFQRTMRFDLRKGFPIITTKKVNFHAVKEELLWFIRGCSDNKELQKVGVHIWDDNANADYWKPKAKFEGDLGRIYGVQERRWRAVNDKVFKKLDLIIGANDKFSNFLIQEFAKYVRENIIKTVDQLASVIEDIKNDPYGTRHITTCWNPAELDQMALPPCHDVINHFFVAEGKLSYYMYQRSCDMFLGVPFNISSSALKLCLVAQVTGLEPYEFIHGLGDVHIYHNHFERFKIQLQRQAYPLPKLWLNPEIKNIDDFKSDDIKLIDYQSHPFIKAEMAV